MRKRFGDTVALDGADLELRAGEIHGVLGENGAGKTTLLGVLAGMVRPDAGSVEIAGRPGAPGSPRAAWARGVGMVHQHFTLVPRLSVLENLALGRAGTRGLTPLPLGRIRAEAEELAARAGLVVPLGAAVEELGVGDRQRVEILRALLRGPRVLVLDEPTAVLTPGEVATLFELLRALAREGTAVALVAHKLDEILAVADRVTVLREGRTVLEAARPEVDGARLAEAMVGPEAASAAATERAGPSRHPDARAGAPTSPWGGRSPRPPGRRRVVARLDGVTFRRPDGSLALDGVSLALGRGEIVGIAGVEGNGQRELARLLARRAEPATGSATLPEVVGFIPQDRTREGLVAAFDLPANVALALHRDAGYRRGPGGWLLDWAAVRDHAAELVDRFDIRAAGLTVRARTLSGGNQQRLVVAREMERAADLLVAENPTRGLDIAAARFVHGALEQLAGRSPAPPAVALISTDLDEVLALSDRVLVMVRGTLIPVPEGARTRAGVGRLMLSGAADA